MNWCVNWDHVEATGILIAVLCVLAFGIFGCVGLLERAENYGRWTGEWYFDIPGRVILYVILPAMAVGAVWGLAVWLFQC